MNLSAGFGVATITPDVPVALAGFGDRTEPAARVHDELQARALYLSDGERHACLIVCDLLGLSEEFAAPIRDAVATTLGIDRSAVLTSCTHTHAGPNAMAGGEALGWNTPLGYGDLLVERCSAAARSARTSAEPARAYAATAPLPDGLSMNRRGLPYDPWFAVLDLRARDERRIGTVANVSIHPVAFGSPWLAVATDWVGPFRAALERLIGGTTILLSGALGDVNPVEHHTDIPTHLDEAVDEVRALGDAVASAVAPVCDHAHPADGPLAVHARTVAVHGEGTMLVDLLGITDVAIELVEWTLGDVHLVAVPGEPFHALGSAIRDARAGVTLIAGLAPIWTGYLPQPYGDGYEESVSLGRDAVETLSRALVAGPSTGERA